MSDELQLPDIPPEKARFRMGWRHIPAAICLTLGGGFILTMAYGVELITGRLF